MSRSVLIVDDDPIVSRLTSATLSDAGFAVKRVKSVDDAVAFMKTASPDLFILDINLPGLSGFDFLKILRADSATAAVPVIMLSVHKEENYKVHGLDHGADDYVVKPFSSEELLSRVRALLRRTERTSVPTEILQVAGIRLELQRQEVFVDGRGVNLRPTELKILALLMRQPGYVLSYRQIAEALAEGGKDLTSGNIHNHINNLRTKLGGAGELIETVHGTGYKFAERRQ